MSRVVVKVQRKKTSESGIVTRDPVKYLLRAVGGTCVEDQAAFTGLSDADKQALSGTMPAPDSGFYWAIKNCSISSLTIELSNSDFLPDDTGGGGEPVVIVPPVAGDPSSYGVVRFFTYP